MVAFVAAGGNDGLVLGLLGRQRVKVGVRFGVGRIDGVELFARLDDVAQAALDCLAHRLLGVEFRLLGQITDLQIGHRPGFALNVGINTGHDFEQGGFTRTVQAEHADLGARKERQRDVLENLSFGRHDLADPVHRVNILRHGDS